MSRRERPSWSTIGTMPSPEMTLVFMVVEGRQFDFFTNYTCGSSLFEADSPFEFSAPIIGDSELREVNGNNLDVGKVVEIYVRVPTNRPKAVLQYIGIIKTIDFHATREGGGSLHVSGRSHLAPIVDSDVMPVFSIENVTFADVIRRTLIDPPPGGSFGFFAAHQITIDNDANRALLTGNVASGKAISQNAPPELETLKIDQAKPHAGETIFAYLQRHATRMGLMIWGTADGRVVFGRPNYNQQPLYDLNLRRGNRGLDNTAKSFSRKRSIEHRASEIHVYGHSKGGDQMRSPIHAVVYDDELRRRGIYRPRTVHDNCARTQTQAEQRAKLELSRQLQSADVVNATVEGHGSNGSVWATDTCVSVSCDDMGMVDEHRYVVARTFTRSRERGTETHLHVMPKNSIVLGDIQYIPPKQKGVPFDIEDMGDIPFIGTSVMKKISIRSDAASNIPFVGGSIFTAGQR